MIDTWPFIAVMASALLHATWNGLARAGKDPGDLLASAVVISGVLSAACIPFVGLPGAASWPWLAFGIVANTIGIRLAMAAYRTASYGLVYPVMRAGIPLLSLPVGALLLQEWPRPAGVLGVLLIGGALIMLAVAARGSGRAELRGFGLALLAAVAGCGYVTSDAVGVRVSGNFFGYALTVMAGNALAMVGFLALEGRNLTAITARHLLPASAISLLSITSFLLYVWALSQTPVAIVASLRETSVIFAIFIARFALKERVGIWHWMASLMAMAGVAAIRLG